MRKLLLFALCGLLLTGCGSKPADNIETSVDHMDSSAVVSKEDVEPWLEEDDEVEYPSTIGKEYIDNVVNSIGYSTNYSDAGRWWETSGLALYEVTQGYSKYFVNMSGELIRLDFEGDIHVFKTGAKDIVKGFNIVGNKAYFIRDNEYDSFLGDAYGELVEYDLKQALDNENYQPTVLDKHTFGPCYVKDGYIYYLAVKRGFILFSRRDLATGEVIEESRILEDNRDLYFLPIGVNDKNELVFMREEYDSKYSYGTINFDTKEITTTEVDAIERFKGASTHSFPFYSDNKLTIVEYYSTQGIPLNVYEIEESGVKQYSFNLKDMDDNIRTVHDICRYGDDFILLTDQGFYRISLDETVEQRQILAERNGLTFDVVGDEIYYMNWDREYFKFNIDGSGWCELTDHFLYQ